MKQEAQLSQRDCRMLRVIEYVARSFKVIRIEISDVKLEFFSKSKLESKKSIKTRNLFLIVS